MNGHNNPPASEAFAMAINDLKAEADNFLDGEAIENEGQAEAITKIVNDMKEYLRDAEKTRKAEKEPFLQAGRKVDATWKKVTDPAKLVVAAAEKPLTVWRVEQDRIKNAEAKKLRECAEQEAREALAMREQANSLADMEAAEEAIKSAKIATATANKIERSSTGLRTSWETDVVNAGSLLRWIKENSPGDLHEFLNAFAKRNVELAKAGRLPGVEAREVKKAI